MFSASATSDIPEKTANVKNWSSSFNYVNIRQKKLFVWSFKFIVNLNAFISNKDLGETKKLA